MTEVAPAKDSISIGGVLDTLPDQPISSSRDRGWSGVTLDVHRHMPGYTVRTPARDHHVICYCQSGGAKLIQGRDGRTHEGMIIAGMSLLMPAGYDATWGGDAAPSARLRIPPSLIAAAAAQMAPRSQSQFEVRNVFETQDQFIERIALTLMTEIDRPAHPAQALIADTTSCALAAHLLRSYNGFDMPADAEVPALNPIELRRLRDYVEDNLDRPIELADLAGLVHVSRFHFARLFRRSTGATAIAYVESRRIVRAKSLIADTDLPLAHVALMVGFADQSHFTKRFRRHVGCTPATFARSCGRRRSHSSAH